MKLAIAIPTYNEAGNIEQLLPAIRQSLESYPRLTTTVYIIDDNSPDGTAKTATKLRRKLAGSKFAVKLIPRDKKEGLGKAYIYGLTRILDDKPDFVATMDADFSHNPSYLTSFLRLTKDADFVVGSRYIPGGSTPDWAWGRKLQSRGGNLYLRLFLGSRITDYTGGYNVFSADLLRKVRLETISHGGYGFLIELKYRALARCNAVQQIPIIFMDRQVGQSKIPKSTIVRNVFLALRLRSSHMTNRLFD